MVLVGRNAIQFEMSVIAELPQSDGTARFLSDMIAIKASASVCFKEVEMQDSRTVVYCSTTELECVHVDLKHMECLDIAQLTL